MSGLDSQMCNAGGVSMGDKDFIKPILERQGKVHFGKVNISGLCLLQHALWHT